jgi:hypothetical protein
MPARIVEAAGDPAGEHAERVGFGVDHDLGLLQRAHVGEGDDASAGDLSSCASRFP